MREMELEQIDRKLDKHRILTIIAACWMLTDTPERNQYVDANSDSMCRK